MYIKKKVYLCIIFSFIYYIGDSLPHNYGKFQSMKK